MSANKHLDKLIELVDLFIDMESSMETYYELCAKIFPDEKFAWFGISTQESIHAKIFKKMKELMIANPEKWSAGKYNYEALRTTLDAIHGRIKDIKNNNYISRAVVVFAQDIESSLVESDMKNAFIAEGEEYRNMVEKIIEETIEHKQFITRFMSQREDTL